MSKSEIQPRVNRFNQHKGKIAIATMVIFALAMEGVSALIVWSQGHWTRRNEYPYNRIVSGYTVYRHIPHFDFSATTIRQNDEPPVILDEHGFICDETINLDKPAGTVRIFLMGGSAAIGAGQTYTYSHVHDYPHGVYSYPWSIAGQLKHWLSEQDPQQRYQVITAASFGRRLHQSLLEYLESVSRFHPDLVISFDGMNDLDSLDSGTPYADLEGEFGEYLGLWADHFRKPLFKRTCTYYVGTKLLNRIGIGRRLVTAPSPAAPTEQEILEGYRANREHFIASSQRFLQILRQFQATVRVDGGQFVFALQPLLHRQGTNKKLSRLESELNTVLHDAAKSRERALRLRQINQYFFDDYLSGRISDELRAGGTYVDMNAALSDLGSDVEIFTDYCHLTFEGNQYVARRLGQECIRRLKSNGVD